MSQFQDRLWTLLYLEWNWIQIWWEHLCSRSCDRKITWLDLDLEARRHRLFIHILTWKTPVFHPDRFCFVLFCYLGQGLFVFFWSPPCILFCRPGWPQTHSYPTASASWELGLKASVTTPYLDPDLKARRHTPFIQIWATPSSGSLYIKDGGRKIQSFLACPLLVSTTIPSLESPSSGFQHTQKTSRDSQPSGTEKPLNSWTSIHSQPLWDYCL